jgi:SNF2 family DNA or RNA helicase
MSGSYNPANAAMNQNMLWGPDSMFDQSVHTASTPSDHSGYNSLSHHPGNNFASMPPNFIPNTTINGQYATTLEPGAEINVNNAAIHNLHPGENTGPEFQSYNPHDGHENEFYSEDEEDDEADEDERVDDEMEDQITDNTNEAPSFDQGTGEHVTDKICTNPLTGPASGLPNHVFHAQGPVSHTYPATVANVQSSNAATGAFVPMTMHNSPQALLAMDPRRYQAQMHGLMPAQYHDQNFNNAFGPGEQFVMQNPEHMRHLQQLHHQQLLSQQMRSQDGQHPKYALNSSPNGRQMAYGQIPNHTQYGNGGLASRDNNPPHPHMSLQVHQSSPSQDVLAIQQQPVSSVYMMNGDGQQFTETGPRSAKRGVDEVITINDSNSDEADFDGNHTINTNKKTKLEFQENKPGNATGGPITIDSSDDEVQITKVIPKVDKEANRIVCIGRLDPCFAMAFKVPNPGHLPEKLTHWPRMRVKIRDSQHNSGLMFILTDPAGADFAKLDPTTARVMRKTIDLSERKLLLEKLEIYLKRRPMIPGEEAGDAYPAGVSYQYSLDFTFNLPKKYAAEVAAFVKRFSLHLTDKGLRKVVPEDEPQDEEEVEMWMPRAGNSNPMESEDAVEREALLMINSFTTSGEIGELEQPSIVVSPLLDHQKKALYFMTEREKNPFVNEVDERFLIWKPKMEDGNPVYYNKALDMNYSTMPNPSLGGILADDMGLGKTLSILALIATTLPQANIFGLRPPTVLKNGSQKQKLKATLVIVPKTLLEANWQKQIDTHLAKDSVKVVLFYGPDRARDLKAFKNADIVITTYGIIEADSRTPASRGGPILSRADWFRIVLDEAHTIRNQDTNRARACCVIEAPRRWAVTGTPIQNHIMDFGSLCTFLRLHPFDTKARFQKHIEVPFRDENPVVLSRLRIIVDTMTLRRTKDNLGLPEKIDAPVQIEMSDKERQLYDVLELNTFKQIKAMTHNRTKMAAGTMGHFLKKLGILRQFCAHKQDMLSQDDLKLLKGFTADAPIEIEDDEDEEVEMNNALDMLNMLKDCDRDYCEYCKEKIQFANEAPEDETEESTPPPDACIGYMNACYHLICPKCINKFTKEQKDNIIPHAPNHYGCRTCDRAVRTDIVEFTRNTVQAFFRRREELRAKPRIAKQLGTYTGPSSKVLYLLSNCQQFKEWNAAHPDDLPMKAVVFTYWTTHLDLIEIALEDHDVKFTRLDGRMGHRQRLDAINQFEQDKETIIFLVSIGAGGVGLNLTSANVVFIMEPQWNPQAEQQAVDRVHRIGQTRTVRVARLIAADSIEEKIQKIGARKLELARVTLTKKLGRKEEREQKMKELQSLFTRRR